MILEYMSKLNMHIFYLILNVFNTISKKFEPLTAQLVYYFPKDMQLFVCMYGSLSNGATPLWIEASKLQQIIKRSETEVNKHSLWVQQTTNSERLSELNPKSF